MIIGIRNSPLRLWLIAVALPMAATPLVASPGRMTIELCSADGAVRTLTIPVDRDDGEDNCAKPCHACLTRKKIIKD
jgi:hypothetical protein